MSPQTLDHPKIQPGPIEAYTSFVESMPEEDLPEVFGMNSNAQKSYLFKIAA